MSLARLGVEALETRDCLSTAYLLNGVLAVTGTEGSDAIQVVESNGRVAVGGQSFDAAAVNVVVISGLGGDDVIRDDSSKTSVIYGGMGNDWIYSGRGADLVYGGQGNDAVFGGPGNDTLIGGAGSDAIADAGGVNAIIQGSPDQSRANSAIEAEIVNLANAFRASNGLAPLAVNGRLNQAADLHSLDMTATSNLYGPNQGMQHELNGVLYPGITDRLDAAGYDEWTTSFRYGENIAYGFTSAAAVMQAWMNSPGHRANLLNPEFTEIGVSVRADAAGRLFFTQDFGHLA